MLHVGAGPDIVEAQKPLRFHKNTLDISFLSCCEMEFNIAGQNIPGCAPIDPALIARSIEKENKHSHHVVLSLHCGSEHYPLPSPRIRDMCRFFAEAGASTIICHHSHIFEGIEVHKGVPIFYGLGNFILDMHGSGHYPEHWYSGFAAKLSYGQHDVARFEIIPYIFNRESGLLALSEGAQRDSFFSRLNFLSNITRDNTILTGTWERYCENRYKNWYRPKLARNWLLDYKNNRRNLLPWHYLTNESHSEIIVTALKLRISSHSSIAFAENNVLSGILEVEHLGTKVKRLLRSVL
jgi:hypothetical protein